MPGVHLRLDQTARKRLGGPVSLMASNEGKMDIYFTDYFGVTEEQLEAHGAFNISLITDLPLFIDPFLLFNSEKPEYEALHDEIIRYLSFLRKKSEKGGISKGLIKAWYCFSEVKQNWLGFCEDGNTGRGLGKGFAKALDLNLVHVFQNFGNEQITLGSHLEKLCLIRAGVGRDMISDFTTNLIKDFLLTYTSSFATKHISPELVKSVSVERSYFSYQYERWMNKRYILPFYRGDYVILTPKDLLTKDDTWISHSDMIDIFHDIPNAVENEQLRAEINNYFYSKVPVYENIEPSKEELARAITATLGKYPELIDYYIRIKEDKGDEAVASSSSKVSESDLLYIKQFGGLADLLQQQTGFYKIPGKSKDETIEKIEFFKDVIENKGGHKIFYGSDGKPIRRERDVHILFRLVWHGTPSDVSREVDDGRGPADFKVSRGASDKTLVEFKLASNTQLKRNLEKQVGIYKKASDAETGYKVIICFNDQEFIKVRRILKELDMEVDPHIILIDADNSNKPSASKA